MLKGHPESKLGKSTIEEMENRLLNYFSPFTLDVVQVNQYHEYIEHLKNVGEFWRAKYFSLLADVVAKLHTKTELNKFLETYSVEMQEMTKFFIEQKGNK